MRNITLFDSHPTSQVIVGLLFFSLFPILSNRVLLELLLENFSRFGDSYTYVRVKEILLNRLVSSIYHRYFFIFHVTANFSHFQLPSATNVIFLSSAFSQLVIEKIFIFFIFYKFSNILFESLIRR